MVLKLLSLSLLLSSNAFRVLQENPPFNPKEKKKVFIVGTYSDLTIPNPFELA